MHERKASVVILIGTLVVVALCIIFGTIYGK
jgi:flagellar basal body-associated protein FliL